jgi:hypothetical protein
MTEKGNDQSLMTKAQGPNLKEYSSPKNGPRIGHWDLGFPWALGLGFWSLVIL